MKLECYYPLGHGNAALLEHPLVVSLAQKYQKDVGQIILRFETQDGLIVLPKSTRPKRIQGNIQIFDFELNGLHACHEKVDARLALYHLV